MKRLIPTILVLLFALAACGIHPATPTATDTAISIPLATPTATDTTISIPSPTPTLQACRLPNGFVADSNTPSILFYSQNGVLVYSLSNANLVPVRPQSFHVTSGTSTGFPPVVYFSHLGGPQIIQNTGGYEVVLVSSMDDVFRMAGAICSPYFAYTTAAYVGAGLLTRLYVGTPTTIGTATPALEITSADSQALKPLALDMAGGIPIGVWYTSCQYGIGGTVFDPCNRLTYLDLATGLSSVLVGDGFNPSQLSPDHTWVAYAQPGPGMPLTILNLLTGANYTFPVSQGNDRGSGDGVFSPNNFYVAWLEASGDLLGDTPTYQPLVRVGTTTGSLIGDWTAQDFDNAAQFPVIRATPVAWLDNDSVLIQVDGDSNHAVLRLDLPTTLVKVASDSFAGLTYP